MGSFADLCVPESPQTGPVLEQLFSHGFHLVAIERTLDLTTLIEGAADEGKAAKKQQREAIARVLAPPDLSAFASSSLARFAAAHGARAKLLSRLTVRFSRAEDAATLGQQFSGELAANFDIVAACPLSDAAFSFACDQMPAADLVQLDCRERPAFRLSHAMVRRGRSRGLHFELLLAPMLASSTCRSYTVSVAQNLMQVTGGKAFVFSSGARSVWDVRNHVGLSCVAAMLGAPNHVAPQCVREAPKAVVLRALVRTRTAFGAAAIQKLERQRGVKSVTVVKTKEAERAPCGGVTDIGNKKSDDITKTVPMKRKIDLDDCDSGSPKGKKRKKKKKKGDPL